MIFIWILNSLLVVLASAGNFEVLPTWAERSPWLSVEQGRVNLYRFAGNSAWLCRDDAQNWMIISTNSDNSWGDLRRFWDPFGVYHNAVTFSGQKHVSPTQTFYGSLTYNLDYISRMNRAIDIEPYGLDPFVLCDSTEGDFTYMGPSVNVVFGHHLRKDLWWGIGLDYEIYRGLKKIYSMPEIIRRKIKLDLSLAYQLNRRFVLGLSIRPYDTRDNTKIVKQPDGTEPLLFRYRGEYVFSAVVSKDDRFAIYNGMEILPQIMITYPRLKGIFTAGYYYRWQEVYDNEHLRLYDGYYQGQHYYIASIWRYIFGENLKNSFTLSYRFKYIEDWAEEPVKKYAIYRSYQRRHKFTVTFSKTLNRFPLTLVANGGYDYWLPNKKDYLAHVYREAAIKNLRWSAGAFWQINTFYAMQLGVTINRFREPAIWNYFGDYNSWAGIFGLSYRYGNYLFRVFSKFGRQNSLLDSKSRAGLNISFQLKQFL